MRRRARPRWYPLTQLTVVGDLAQPIWRGRAVGIYRVWRDLGYAVGAILGGLVADAISLTAAISAASTLSLLSGLTVAIRMYETHPRGMRPAA